MGEADRFLKTGKRLLGRQGVAINYAFRIDSDPDNVG